MRGDAAAVARSRRPGALQGDTTYIDNTRVEAAACASQVQRKLRSVGRYLIVVIKDMSIVTRVSNICRKFTGAFMS